MVNLLRIQELLVLACDEVTPGLLTNASQDLIEAFSRFVRLPVPSDVSTWLRHAKGYCLKSGKVLLSLQPQHLAASLLHSIMYDQTWIAQSWLPVGDDGCGDDYVVPSDGDGAGHHPVWFIDQSDHDRPAYVVASEIGLFLEFILEDAIAEREPGGFWWPFERDEMARRDPNIVLCRGAPLPWETGNR
jgi:hypothetical protein